MGQLLVVFALYHNTRTARTDPWSNLLWPRSLENADWTWDQSTTSILGGSHYLLADPWSQRKESFKYGANLCGLDCDLGSVRKIRRISGMPIAYSLVQLGWAAHCAWTLRPQAASFKQQASSVKLDKKGL